MCLSIQLGSNAFPPYLCSYTQHPLPLEAQPSWRDGSLLLFPTTPAQVALAMSMLSGASFCSLPPPPHLPEDLIHPPLCLPRLPLGGNSSTPHADHTDLLLTTQGWEVQRAMVHTSAGFLSLSTTAFWGPDHTLSWGCPMCGMMFSSVPGLIPLEANSNSFPPKMWRPKSLQTLSVSPEWPLVENHHTQWESTNFLLPMGTDSVQQVPGIK